MTMTPPLSRLLPIAGLIAAAVLACSKDGTGPTNRVPTSITLSPASPSLNAIGATQQLVAIVKDQNGSAMSGVALTWTSSDEAVATVSATGLVTAVANGPATITAAAGSVNGQAAVTVAQVAAQVQKISGDAQSAAVGTAVADSLVVQVNDRLGQAITGVTVNFAVSAGGGSVSPAGGATGSNGRRSTYWTLGTLAGTPTVTATPASGTGSAQFTATAQAAAADSVFVVSGSGQTGLPGSALSDSLVVKVVDRYGNGVAGHQVVFTPATDNGSVSPASALTTAAGLATTRWTLGAAVGSQSVQASAGGLKGDPLGFSAIASTLSLSAIAPDTLVEGGTATITGTSFSTTPSANTVTVGGVVATVTAATATSLTITVPSYACQPLRTVSVTVTVGAATSNALDHPLRPASLLNLAVGQYQLISNPTDFCLQFPNSPSSGATYLVGVSAAAEAPGAFLPVQLTAVQGAGTPAPPAPVVAPAPRGTAFAPTGVTAQAFERRAAQYAAEQRLRAWERSHLESLRQQALAAAVSPSPARQQAVPNVGDTLRFHVPNVDKTGGAGNTAGPCDSIPIRAVVRDVGTAGIFVTDIANPTADSLTTAEIQAYSDTFDLHIYAADTTHFGKPSDLDVNQRVFVVLTVQVNKFVGGQIAGFVFSGDLYPVSACASSDYGEIFYGHVPDPNNEAGTMARSKTAVLQQMPSLIAHEFTHNIQQSRRLIPGYSGPLLSTWESEGQATLAEEVVGHSMLGNQPGQDYGASVALTGAGSTWYEFIFYRLGWYYGWTGGAGRNADAPEECTLYGSFAVNQSTPCEPFWFYGSSWSFQRYVADRFGAGYPGGQAALTRDWIGKSPSLAGVPNVEALLGVKIDSVFAAWAAMHYVDNRVVGADPRVLFPSWNLLSVMNGLHAFAPLAPAARSFAGATEPEQVRGGSTVYRLFSGASSHPALALRVRDLSDQVLSTTLKPQLWVVRIE